MTSVTYFALAINQLTGSIPAELGNLTSVGYLTLSTNQLSGSIPTALGDLSSLLYLFLYSNALTGSIPSELGNLTSLIMLRLHGNKLSGVIPTQLSNLTALTELRLDNNQLSGSIPAFLPISIDVSSNPKLDRNILIKLYDSTNGDNWTNKTGWNGIAGTECDWYGVTCSGGDLTELSLSSNNLVGTIPSGLGDLTTLTTLQLGSNSLSGSIPTELGNLTALDYLSFYDNSLTGTIPAQLGNLTNLTYFSLTSNQLSGSIPSELGNLTSVTYFALAINQLTGSIPAELGNLTSVAYLTLGTNQLSGSIPTALGDLSSLLYLFLYSNALTGSIPSELGNLTSLIMLRLHGNKLSGVIPTQLSNLTALTELRLDNNQLAGPLPQWLSDMAISTLNVTDAFTSAPVVAISGGSRTIEDSDGIAGESVSFTGTATDSDGTIATTQWLVDGSEVATGLSATIALSDGATVVTFKATDNDGAATSATATITVEVPNVSPSVAISGGNRTIADTDNAAGESVSFTGTATDSDGTIATTQWLVDGSEVATGLSATISLPNGLTVVTFKATDNDDDSSTATVTITITNIVPDGYISGGSRTIADTDGIAGESVSFTGTATDSDGTIATTQWLVGGSVVATGLTPSIALPNGSTVVTFKVTDNDGASSTKTVAITVATPTYTVTDEWPSPYNGVTPDSSLGLAFNNIGSYDTAGSTIYTCLRVFTDGLPGSVGGIGEFDIGFTVVSIDEGTIQITKFREFNVIGALNENVELPDCSGKFETTTGVFTDTIETKSYLNFLGNLLTTLRIFETTFDLVDADNLILKLSGYQELTAN